MYTETRTDREDLRQDITYQLWKAWPNFRRDRKASTGVYRIALNTAISRVRKRKSSTTASGSGISVNWGRPWQSWRSELQAYGTLSLTRLVIYAPRPYPPNSPKPFLS